MSSLSQLCTLIVDPQPAMRSGLRNMLAQCGMTDVDEAASAAIGLRKLAERRYDLVVCEYHLGDGQDGQHFLEDARQHSLLPHSTIFIMLTGEAAQGRVMSAAEFAPNDYILKPFAADTLLERLERAVAKRAAFLSAYEAIEMGNVHGAIAQCNAAEKQHPQHLADFHRLKAELHLAVGEPEAAQTIYRRIMDARALPWSRLGLGKALFMQKRYADAEEILLALIGEHRQYVDAYDWLARAKEARGDLKGAQQVIADGVALSPHALRRLRRLGEVALEAGDAEVAERALAEVVRKGKYSEFRDPEDHVLLVKTQLARGDSDAARETLGDMEKTMRGLKKTEICAALSSALVHVHEGDGEKAREAFGRALAANASDGAASERLKLDLASGCLAHEMEDEAGALLHDVMRNAADAVAVQKAKDVLKRAGKADLAESMEQQIRSEVKELVASGASRAYAGDYEGAVELMREAARKMPGNVNVALNTTLALLKQIENRGWDEKVATQAMAFLDQARRRDASHERLSPLSAYYHAMLAKYGIRPGRLRPQRVVRSAVI
jgi:CheY-like chemotaxis protein